MTSYALNKPSSHKNEAMLPAVTIPPSWFRSRGSPTSFTKRTPALSGGALLVMEILEQAYDIALSSTEDDCDDDFTLSSPKNG